MRVIAFNGSPRKHWNTATLLEKALDGAKSQGAKTKLIHLYDLNYKGCISCFACKAKGGKSYGKCSVTDDLKSIFDKIELARYPHFWLSYLFGKCYRRDARIFGTSRIPVSDIYGPARLAF